MAIKSLLRYPGGKGKAMPFLLEHMPDGIKDWREPFFGGGSVTIGFLQSPKSKDCQRFVVGDLYPEVYSFWKGIQQNPSGVIECVYSFMRDFMPNHAAGAEAFLARKDVAEDIVAQAIGEGKAFWNWGKSIDKNTLTLEQRAARFFIVNRTSFSGMGDAGSMTNDQLFDFKPSDIEKAYEMSKLLAPVEILNASFEVTMANIDASENGFVFLDPPYFQQSSQGTGSGMYGGTGKESTHNNFPHEKLRDLLVATKSKWLMTYDDSIAVRKWYAADGIDINPFHLTYTMAGKTATDALAGEEILISNYLNSTTSDEEVEDF